MPLMVALALTVALFFLNVDPSLMTSVAIGWAATSKKSGDLRCPINLAPYSGLKSVLAMDVISNATEPDLI